MGTLKQDYEAIIEICKNHEGVEQMKNILQKVENCIEILRWKDEYGIILDDDAQIVQSRYVDMGYHGRFIYFTDAESDHKNGNGYSISWSDDGKQPLNEWLLDISFPTGAYIFGDDYPQELFNRLFTELKTYNPKFVDSANKCLYFTLDNAGKILNEYRSIRDKYNAINAEESKQRKIDKMKKELEKLEGNNPTN